jgi:hypothetical protein
MLKKQQATKADVEARAAEFCDEKNSKLQEMSLETNIIKKALLYCDAAEAYEKMDFTGFRSFKWIPSMEAVLSIQDGLLLGREGTLWTRGKDLLSKKAPLGTATIRPDGDASTRGTLNESILRADSRLRP